MKRNRLTLIRQVENNKYNHRCGLYRCICGTEKIIEMYCVETSKVLSCGCLHKEINNLVHSTHGFTGNPILKIWYGMKDRCENKAHDSYANYGGRGIKICEDWQDSSIFLQWAQTNGYKKGLRIDRFPDNDGNYEPNNCRWVTPKENSNNRRNNVYITYNGETKTLQQWSEKFGINKNTLRSRIVVYKMPPEVAFFKQKHSQFKRIK